MLTSPSSEVPKGKKNEGKAYIVLYACSLTRGIYLELLPNMETTEFITSLKRFITHRGRPEKINSDNGKTFVGAVNLLKTIMMDKKVHDYLAKHRIMWQFNLSRAPGWEGERIITHPLILARFYWSRGENSQDSYHAITTACVDICPPIVSMKEKHSKTRVSTFPSSYLRGRKPNSFG